MSKKNILVGQSGGPTSVFNASLYGVVSAGMAHADRVDKVIGMVNGIEGFLQGKTTVLSDVPRRRAEAAADHARRISGILPL